MPSLAAIFAPFLVVVGVLVGTSSAAGAQAAVPSSETAWRLLDYLAVDYSGAVQNGRVVSDSEYAEMKEFAGAAQDKIASLPLTPAKQSLLAQAQSLRGAIDQKASATEVANQAHKLAADLLAAYPTVLAPSAAPDLASGAKLYAENCASCHGMTGHADGPAAAGLDPPPIAFADRARARERSIFGLYQVIQQGLDGTSMPSFSRLPANDRWALAFYVAGLSYSDADVLRGETLWKSDPELQREFPDLRAVTQITEAQLARQLGDEEAGAVTGYLRRHPEAATTPQIGGPMATVRERLGASVKAYTAGDRRKAGDLALSAYLDGFEPLEPVLSARDPALMRRIEASMGELRGQIGKGAPLEDVMAQTDKVYGLLDAAERALSSQTADAGASFAGAFTVLLREGLEALLIIVAILAFLRKAGRPEVAAWVHGGWVAALGAGGLTWAAATYLISISGASRELTEGFGSLFAAVVLISVGIWMHGKSHADAWQAYIHEKMSKALTRRSAWFLFLLAFIVVYREVFETILFLIALWTQGSGPAMLAGVGAAAIVLASIAWALLSYSRRLPISQFFSLSSILLAILAVVLAGKGVSGLQEAGLLDLTPIRNVPRIDILGVFPTWQTVIAQLMATAALVLGFRFTSGAPGK